MTLREFINKCGSVERASRRIGCSSATLFRILKGKTKRQSDMLIMRLQELGVTLEDEKKEN